MKLENGEQIIKVIRKHPFYIILQATLILILAISPNLILILMDWVFNLLPANFDFNFTFDPNLQAFWYLLWLLFLWIILFTRFTDYYLDKWVITNKRIIDVDQRDFFSREVSSARYPKIQDATVESVGVVATLLNFGTITVQTAGTEQEFIFPLTPNPIKNKEFILAMKQNWIRHNQL
jgi:uncharacterized membrane protein YdbT with pleckstrin-like domain